MSDPKTDALQRVYAAFGRGDLNAIIAELADDIDWISVSEEYHPVVPWYGRYRGKGEVPRFFKEIGTSVTVTDFIPLSFTANETDVMVALKWAFTHSNGQERCSTHAALVALHRREDRIRPDLRGHRQNRSSILLDQARHAGHSALSRAAPSR